MKYSTKLEFDDLSQAIYKSIKRSMSKEGRDAAVKKYGSSAKELSGCWEGYHLLRFATSIRPCDKQAQDELDICLSDKGINNGFATIQNNPSKNGFTLKASDNIFDVLAKFKGVPLLVCFLNFLKFSDDEGFLFNEFKNEKGEVIEISVKELINHIEKDIASQIKKLETEESQDREPKPSPSTVQPRLTIKQVRKNNPNYYANTTLKVIGRENEQQRLRDFLNCDKNVAWFQLSGVAGQGKSRLAFGLIHEAIDLGWSAGLLEENDMLFFEGLWKTWQPDKPHLLVFDYILGREGKIKPILQTLIYRQYEFIKDIRILLVERQRWDKGISAGATADESEPVSSKADWFLKLCQDTEFDGEDQHLINSRFDDGVEELLKLEQEDLRSLVKQITEKTSGITLEISDTDIDETLNRIDKSGRPLYAYFIGHELAFNADGFKCWTDTQLLTKTLEREFSTRWKTMFHGQPPAFGDNHIALKIAVLATMVRRINFDDPSIIYFFGKIDSSEAKQVGTIIDGNHSSGIHRQIEIFGMEPDLLGEWFVIKNFEEGLNLQEISDIAWQVSPEEMGAFLSRISQDFFGNRIIEELFDSIRMDKLDAKTISNSEISIFLINYCINNKRPIPKTVLNAFDISTEKLNFPDFMYMIFFFLNCGYSLQELGIDKPFDKSVRRLLRKIHRIDANETECVDGAIMSLLAEFYYHGIAVKKDATKAAYWFEMASNVGHVGSIGKLGALYHKGEGVKPDLGKAIDLLKKAAEQNDAYSLNELGICYLNGYGVKNNSYNAFKLFEKSLAIHRAPAIGNLGACYLYGYGAKRNIDKAIMLFNEGVSYGDSTSQFCLARCYQKGHGVKKDLSKAFNLFEQAYNAKDWRAAFELASFYIDGNVVEKNADKAIELFLEGGKNLESNVLTAKGFWGLYVKAFVFLIQFIASIRKIYIKVTTRKKTSPAWFPPRDIEK